MTSEMTRRGLLRTTVLLGTVALSGTAAGVVGAQAANATSDADTDADADCAADRIVHGIRRPRIPRRDFPITGFGAVGDGATDNTAAIAAAIQAAAAHGGGRVVVPPGSWATGPIRLASRIELHVAAGATLLFSTDPAAYLPAVYSRWQGIELMNYSPLIYAHGARHRCHRLGSPGRAGVGG